jgi:hypothetical protein
VDVLMGSFKYYQVQYSVVAFDALFYWYTRSRKDSKDQRYTYKAQAFYQERNDASIIRTLNKSTTPSTQSTRRSSLTHVGFAVRRTRSYSLKSFTSTERSAPHHPTHTTFSACLNMVCDEYSTRKSGADKSFLIITTPFCHLQ